jgi:hypothetical protein
MLTYELVAITFASESFHALINPIAILINAILRSRRRDCFRDATIQSSWSWLGVFVPHDLLSLVSFEATE